METFQHLPTWARFSVTAGLLLLGIAVCFYLGAWMVAALNKPREP